MTTNDHLTLTVGEVREVLRAVMGPYRRLAGSDNDLDRAMLSAATHFLTMAEFGVTAKAVSKRRAIAITEDRRPEVM